MVTQIDQIESLGGEIPREYILADLIENKNKNLLYVGEISPEKGILMLIDIVREYINCYGKNVKLRILTEKINESDPYLKEVKEKIYSCKLSDFVEIISNYDKSKLLSFYLGSDVYLSCSGENEDCTSVLTAQYFGLPVIALSESRVIEALGNNQIILGHDIREYVAAIKVITENKNYLEYLEKQGRQNFSNRFSSNGSSKELTKTTGETV